MDRPTPLGKETEIVVSWSKGPSKICTVDIKPWALDRRLQLWPLFLTERRNA